MARYNLQEHIQRLIRDQQIHTIRVSLHDNSNVQRARYVPARFFLESVLEGQIAFPSALFSLDTSARLLEEAGDGFAGGYPSWVLKPDLSTFAIIPYKHGMGRVIADLYYADGNPVSVSPRHVLRKVLEEFAADQYRVYGAFEYEFYVFLNNSVDQPIWQGRQCFSEIKQAEVEDIITSVLFGLTEMGAGPEVANTEYGSGQFEVTNSPFWGMEIADMAFYYRTSIRELLQQKGYMATFMSKPLAEHSGSGAHMNHSIYDAEGHNLFADPSREDGLSDFCRYFIGGQIYHARALTALCNPTINSYKRLKPYSFAPTTASWGYEHRGAMIRVPARRGQQTRLENRLPGSDTNPYIALAAILAAGLDGVRKKIEPPPALIQKDPYATNRTISANLPMLPNSLPEALEALEQDEWAARMLGEEFVQHYILLRRAEWERFLGSVTDWEYKEYLELI